MLSTEHNCSSFPITINDDSGDAFNNMVKIWLAKETVVARYDIITIELINDVGHEI
jgi:hypothetical protein